MFRNDAVFKNLVERLARHILNKSRMFFEEDMINFAKFAQLMNPIEQSGNGEEILEEWLKEKNNK